MMKKLLLILFLFVFSITASSQINRVGTPLISTFDAAETPGDLGNLCIARDKRGVMYFGNESGGIVTYDGTGWGLVCMNSPQKVTALTTDPRGVVFVGGENDFGFLQPDPSGRLKYFSLSSGGADTSLDRINPITSIAADSSSVFFSDGKVIYIYGISGESLNVIDLEKDYGLRDAANIITINGRLFIADNSAGLFEYADGTVKPLPGGEALRLTHFVRLLQFDSENLLIGSSEKGILLYNHRTGALNRRFLAKDDNNRLITGNMTDVVLLPGNLVAVGLNDGGGLYIISREGRLLQHISDKTTILREASVTALYCDYASNGQLWFCTRGYINRAYVSLPACEFGSAAGITSVARCLAGFDDCVFAGTDDGIYTNYTDSSGVSRFRKLSSSGTMVKCILSDEKSDGKVLLAAADDGLWQIDAGGDAIRFLDNMSITAVSADKNDPSLLMAGSGSGLIRTLEYSYGEWSVVNKSVSSDLRGRVSEIVQATAGDWWIMTESPKAVLRMHCEADDTTLTSYGRYRGLDCDTLNAMVFIDSTLYLCSGRGLYSYNPSDDTFSPDNDLIGNTFGNASIINMIKTPGGDIFISGFDSRNFDALVRTTSLGHIVFRKQFDFLPDIPTTGMAYIQDNIWLAKGRSIFTVDISKLGFSYGAFSTIFTEIIAGDRSLMNGTFSTLTPEGVRVPVVIQPAEAVVSLDHNNNDITFRWTTTSYVGEDKTTYSFRLDNFDDEWSGWQRRTYRDYTNLPSGDYVFRLKARTITGLESEELKYSFTVARPWYWTSLALALYSVTLAFIIFVIVRHFLKKLNRLNLRLDNVLRNRREAAEKNKEELRSLEKYAGAVQQITQPSHESLAIAFANSFIINKPRGIVSGDFLWMAGNRDRVAVAVGDSPGHGVSTALRTLLASSLLDSSVGGGVIPQPAVVLNRFHKRMMTDHASRGGMEREPYGMEIGMLAVDRARGIVEYAGASMQCFMVREMNSADIVRWKNEELREDESIAANGKYLLTTISGDRRPLGISVRGEREFTHHEWKLEKETSYYLFSDGYPDQFNGVSGKKFMKKNFRKLILDIQSYSMKTQKEMLEDRLGSWMGSSPQTDDILVVGFRIDS